MPILADFGKFFSHSSHTDQRSLLSICFSIHPIAKGNHLDQDERFCQASIQIAPAKEARLEDRVPELEIELLDAVHRPAERECGGDDGTGRGSADQIEAVGEHRLVVAGVVANEFLDPLQELHGENATDPSVIEGEDTFRSGSEQMRVQVSLFHFIYLSFLARAARIVYGCS